MEPENAVGTETKSAAGLADDCPCELTTCVIRGDCVACVRVHRHNQAHIPECLQPVLRGLVEQLAGQVEYRVVEGRPGR